MPTYDYACDACKHAFEEFQSITAEPLKKCPACGKAKLKRLIGTGGGLIFKGSGFYLTDYRSESYKKAAEADSKPASPAPTGGDAGASKPAADASKAGSSASSVAASAAGGTESPKPAKTSAPTRKSKPK